MLCRETGDLVSDVLYLPFSVLPSPLGPDELGSDGWIVECSYAFRGFAGSRYQRYVFCDFRARSVEKCFDSF